jgi:hypothetical protein
MYNRVVDLEEQPFRRVCNFVENVCQHKDTVGSFNFENSVLQTKGHLQGRALLLCLDMALVADFLSLYRQVNAGVRQSEVHVNL